MSRASPRFHRINPALPLVGAGNGVVLYKIVGSIENQMTISSFMYSAPVNNPSQGQLTTLLANISLSVWNAYRACISVDWFTTKETLDVVHRNDIAGTFSIAHQGQGGQRAAGHMPTEVSAQIIKYTNVKGQHGRGRVSVPAIATADVTASSISAGALLTALGTLTTSYLTTQVDGGGNTYTACVGQRASGSPKLVIGFAPIVRFAIPALLGTIRRRKIGRGK